MLDDFQAAYPEVKVAFEPVAGDYAAAMAAKFSSGDVPDVFYVDSGPAATWIDDGNLEPLDDYIAKTGVDTSVFYPAYLDAFKGADGKIYGLPKDGNTIAMAYNEDMLTAAGVTAPPTNWEELTAAVDKLKGTEGLDAPLCLSPSLDRALAFIYQAGGGLLTEDKTASMIETPESITGIDTYLNFFKSGAAKRPGRHGRRLVRQVPRRGPLGHHLRGRLARPVHEGDLPGREVRLGRDARRARPARPPSASPSPTRWASTRQNKDASWALINYLTGPEGMKTWTEGGVANPSRSDLQGAPGKEILVNGAEYARPWSFIPGFSEINDAFNNALTGAIEGSGSAQDIATATKEAIDSNLQ